MSTNEPHAQLNGDKVLTNYQTGVKSSNNGIVINSVSTPAPVVNGNGQLGATAMFNLAQIASSEQKQTVTTLSNTNSTPVAVPTHNAVGTVAAVAASGTAPVTICSAPTITQTRPQPIQQNNTPLRPAQALNAPLLIPRNANNTISLPPGLQLPPGTILMQNEKGHIVFMPRAPAPQNLGHPPATDPQYRMVQRQFVAHHPPIIRQLTPQANCPGDGAAIGSHAVPNHHQPHPLHRSSYLSQQQASSGAIPIQPNPGQVIMRPAVAPAMQAIRAQTNIVSRPIMPASAPDRSKDETKKCKNFLETLIRLSSQQPQQTLDNVKRLILGLLEGTVQPDVFTVNLQKELNSQRQPGLAAFLKKSLPDLRLAISRNELSIDGLNRPNIQIPVSSLQNNVMQPMIRPSPKPMVPKAPSQQKAQGISNIQRMSGPVAMRPSSTASPLRPAQSRVPATSAIPRGKQRLDLKDDDDINDVATMGGVNLSEETKNILAAVPESAAQLRSCRDDAFLSHTPLAHKIRQLALQRGVRDINSDVISFVSHACEERLRHLTEKVSLVAEHRLDIYRVDKRFDPSHDVRSQLKFLEELDKLERKKHDDSEREVLLRAAKSRSKTEDPEQAKLKIKAKELKEQELEELRQQEANKTALAAIGPRKKRKIDDIITGAGNTAGLSTSAATASTNNQGYNRPRLKRVNLRDLTFVLEEDRDSYKSDTLFKAFLR